MKCSGCGREDGLVRRGRVFECTHCHAVTVAGEVQADVPVPPADELSAAERDEAAKLAQIHERARAERTAKDDRARLQQDPARAPCLICWLALAGVVLLAAAGAALLLAGGGTAARPVAESDGRDLLWHAEQGDVGAQLGVALVYEYGLGGVPTAPGQAGRWYRKAAEAGDINAQYHLGLWYQSAAPSPSPQEALQWLLLAAERGHAGAQTQVADAYRFGQHRERDVQRAAEWYAKAAEQGNIDALCSLAQLNGGAEGFPQDQIAASMYEALAAGLGRECPRAVGVAEAPDWAKAAGVRRAKEKLAKGFGKKTT